MKKLLVMILACSVFAACSNVVKEPPPMIQVKNVTYEGYIPKEVPSNTDPKLLVEQGLYAQGRKKSPTQVEVTDRFFRTAKPQAKASIWTGGVTTVTYTESVSFPTIRKVVFSKGRYYYVNLYDESNKRLYRLVTRQESVAKDFVDGLYTLINKIE